MKENEKTVQAAILQYLALKSVFHYRNNSGAMKKDDYYVRFGFPGSPDIICVIEGYFVGIEVKGPRGVQSDDQKLFQQALTDAGGIYFLVRSIDEAMEAIEDCITRLRIKGRTIYKNNK